MKKQEAEKIGVTVKAEAEEHYPLNVDDTISAVLSEI